MGVGLESCRIPYCTIVCLDTCLTPHWALSEQIWWIVPATASTEHTTKKRVTWQQDPGGTAMGKGKERKLKACKDFSSTKKKALHTVNFFLQL